MHCTLCTDFSFPGRPPGAGWARLPRAGGRLGGTAQPPPKGAGPRPARAAPSAAPVPSRDELSDAQARHTLLNGSAVFSLQPASGTPGSPKPLRPPRGTTGPSQPTKADQGPATLRLLLPRPAPHKGSGPAPHPSLRGFQKPARVPLPPVHRPRPPPATTAAASPLRQLPTGGQRLLASPPPEKTYTKRFPIGSHCPHVMLTPYAHVENCCCR